MFAGDLGRRLHGRGCPLLPSGGQGRHALGLSSRPRGRACQGDMEGTQRQRAPTYRGFLAPCCGNDELERMLQE